MRAGLLFTLFVMSAPAFADTAAPAAAAAVDSQRMRAADREPGQWMSYSRTWDEQRFSPLKQINDGNAGNLGLAWYADLNTYRGVQATPLFIDGVLYNVSVWNVVTAYDAHNGKVLWTYDPKVAPRVGAPRLLRPVGARHRRVEGQDLHRRAGRPADRGRCAHGPGDLVGADLRSAAWPIRSPVRRACSTARSSSAMAAPTTACAASSPRTTPRPASKLLALLHGARRSVEGPGRRGLRQRDADGHEDLERRVVEVRRRRHRVGFLRLRPEAEAGVPRHGQRLAAHVQHFRSPGGGDNLFLCSIVAVNAETGQVRLALPDGAGRAMGLHLHAADRARGPDHRRAARARCSCRRRRTASSTCSIARPARSSPAKTYVPNLWASSIDLKTGRPIVNPESYLTETPQLMTPTLLAAHTLASDVVQPAHGARVFLRAGTVDGDVAREGRATSSGCRSAPTAASLTRAIPKRARSCRRSRTAARRATCSRGIRCTQTEAFRVPYPYPGSGGVLTTAGNLLVQGTINRTLAVYRADNGSKLWEMPIRRPSPSPGPMTYELDGEQYIAVNFGWGGSPVHGIDAARPPVRFGPGRLMVFKLGATGVALPPMPPPSPIPPPPPLRATEDMVRKGQKLFGETCSRCHGENARGGLKDLRFMTPETRAQFNDDRARRHPQGQGHGRLPRHPERGRCRCHPRLPHRARQRGLERRILRALIPAGALSRPAIEGFSIRSSQAHLIGMARALNAPGSCPFSFGSIR